MINPERRGKIVKVRFYNPLLQNPLERIIYRIVIIRPDGNCLLDFSVVNNGVGTVIVEDVVLTVVGIDKRMSILRSTVNGDDSVDISALYYPGDKAECHIRLEVPPTKAEPFSILLRSTSAGYTERRWMFDVTLQTNAGALPVGQLPKEIIMKIN